MICRHGWTSLEEMFQDRVLRRSFQNSTLSITVDREDDEPGIAAKRSNQKTQKETRNLLCHRNPEKRALQERGRG